MLLEITRRHELFLDIFNWLFETTKNWTVFSIVWLLLKVVFSRTSIRCCYRRNPVRLIRCPFLRLEQWKRSRRPLLLQLNKSLNDEGIVTRRNQNPTALFRATSHLPFKSMFRFTTEQMTWRSYPVTVVWRARFVSFRRNDFSCHEFEDTVEQWVDFD